MKKELLLVVDESGGGSSPMDKDDGDFGVGGLLFFEEELERIVDVSKVIQSAVKTKDYKYRHVAKSTQAREAFVDLVKSFEPPAGVFGLYANGRSLPNERVLSANAMASFGMETGGLDASVEAIKKGDVSEHLRVFLTYFTPCIMTYAGAQRTPIHVYWDNRSDMSRVMENCDAERSNFKDDPRFGDISSLVSFKGVAKGKLNAVAKVAGILAGDIRAWFGLASNGLSEKLQASPHVVADDDLYRKVLDGDIPYADFHEQMCIGHFYDEFAASGKELPMLRSYSMSFIESTLSFVSREGHVCHMIFQESGGWKLYRYPD